MTIRIIFNQPIALFGNLINVEVPHFNTMYAASVYMHDRAPGVISSEADSRFIQLQNKSNDLDLETNDFSEIAVIVADPQNLIRDHKASFDLLDIESAIESWAKRSEVVGARGDRFAFISAADKIVEGGITHYIWEVTLSSMVIYNHRRAIVNFPRTQDEADADMSNLQSYIKQIDNSLVVQIQN